MSDDVEKLRKECNRWARRCGEAESEMALAVSRWRESSALEARLAEALDERNALRSALDACRKGNDEGSSALSEARAEVERLRLRLKDLREELHDYWAGDSCKYADGAEADEANECGDISCRAHRAWRALEWDSAALTPSDGQTEAETWPSEAAREAWDRALALVTTWIEFSEHPPKHVRHLFGCFAGWLVYDPDRFQGYAEDPSSGLTSRQWESLGKRLENAREQAEGLASVLARTLPASRTGGEGEHEGEEWIESVSAGLVADVLAEVVPEALGPDAPEDKGCRIPPPGWWCSRDPGHEGPCAARPLDPASQPVRVDESLARARTRRGLGLVVDEVEAELARILVRWGVRDLPLTRSELGYGLLDQRLMKELVEEREKAGKLSWADILLEEVAEALEEDNRERQMAELVQVAAVAITAIECIGRASQTGGEK